MRVFYFYSGKIRCRNFFLKLVIIFFKSCACTVISSDIIQVRPSNLIEKASAHLVDLISPQMKKLKLLGAQNSRKYWSIHPEMDVRIIKQCDITSNGPQRASGTALRLWITMF